MARITAAASRLIDGELDCSRSRPANRGSPDADHRGEQAALPRLASGRDGPLEWFGAIGATLAAGLIAADLARRVTGWAFVLFLAVSVAWVVSGVINDTWPRVAQTGWLTRPGKRRSPRSAGGRIAANGR